jgi:hypothetical protein
MTAYISDLPIPATSLVHPPTPLHFMQRAKHVSFAILFSHLLLFILVDGHLCHALGQVSCLPRGNILSDSDRYAAKQHSKQKKCIKRRLGQVVT